MTRTKTKLELACLDAIRAQNNWLDVSRSGKPSDAVLDLEHLGLALGRLLVETRRAQHRPGVCPVCDTHIGDDVGSYYHRKSCDASHFGEWLKDMPLHPYRSQLERDLEMARFVGD